MRPLVVSLLLAALIPLATPREARALIPLGASAPNFTKTDLTGTPRSLSDYSGKVVVLFLLGWD